MISARTGAIVALLGLSALGTALHSENSGAVRIPFAVEHDDALATRERLPINAIDLHNQRYPDGEARERYITAVERFFAWMATSSQYLLDETLEQRLQDGRIPNEPDIVPTWINPNAGLIVRFVAEPAVIEVQHNSTLRAQSHGYTRRAEDQRLAIEIYRFDRSPRSPAGLSHQEELNLDYSLSLYRVLESVILTLGVWDKAHDNPPELGSLHRRYYGRNYFGPSASRGGYFRQIANMLVGPRESIVGNNALLHVISPVIQTTTK